MSRHERYSAEDDKRTIAFWIWSGGAIASVVTLCPFFFIFTLAVTYMITRGLENIDAGRPVYMPGKHSRHLRESIDRASSPKVYSGGYTRRTRRDRNY